MLVLGRPCHVCDERILELSVGIGCVACGAQFHETCLPKKGLCAKCGVDMRAATAEAAASEQAELARSLTTGQRVLAIATALCLLPQFAAFVLAVTTDGEAARAAFRVAIGVLAFAAVHRGNVGVAKGVIALAAIGGVAEIAIGALSGSIVLLLMGGTAGVCLLAGAAMLYFSRDVWAYLHHVGTPSP